MSCSDKRFFGNMIPITGEATPQKNLELLAGPGIKITDLSSAAKYRFKFQTIEVDALTVELTLVAKASSIVKSNPVLKGTVIDTVELSWTYNRVISSQTLTNDGALTPPSLLPGTMDYTYSGQNIGSDINFTLTGSDGTGLQNGLAEDAKSIQFGNVMWLGYGASKIGALASGIEAFIESLQTSVVKPSRVHTYFATGGVNQKHFVAYPKSFGLATFTKTPFNGGYVRLKNVLGVLKSELEFGDIEIDVNFTNSEGYTEAYYIYESIYDNQVDAETPFIIS